VGTVARDDDRLAAQPRGGGAVQRDAGPRQVPLASPALPASGTSIDGTFVSILKVIVFQASRMPARSTARYSKVVVPFAVTVAGWV
jgi:hypothetical protein